MSFVRVMPLNVDIEVEPGEPLAVAAWRLGYRWPTLCWGQAECMLCRVRVLEGEQNIEAPQPDEVDALRRRLIGSLDRVRLGCRLRVLGEGVVVEKKGVVPPKQ